MLARYSNRTDYVAEILNYEILKMITIALSLMSD